MFGIWRSKKPEVFNCEQSVFEQFECSPMDFYASIEEEIQAHGLPGMVIERIEYKEGGLLSAHRTYLRLRRERLVFDVCFAPFGPYWFYSQRFAVIPNSMRVWEAIVAFLVITGVYGFYVQLFGLLTGSALLVGSILTVVLLTRNLVALGLQDLDAALIQFPVIGALYENWVRKETFFREDSRAAYLSIVKSILKRRLSEFTEARGAKLIEFSDRTPPTHPSVMRLIGALLKFPK